MSSTEWNERDIKLLNNLYPIYGAAGLTDVFHERTIKSIRRKANELGIRVNSDVRKERNQELARRKNEAQRIASGKMPPPAPAKDFSEYEKVSSIFSVGRRCRALFDGGFVQGD